jgi:Cys-tRNA(Pro)/Cys-tRNA(Cys) deacylase
MSINNVTRMLDAAKARYQIFLLPERKVGALETAEFLSVPLEMVFKTIVLLRSKGKPILCVVPGTAQVDEKAVASFVNEKKVHVAPLQQAESLTGLKAGGISPLALINKGFDCIFDQSIHTHKEIHLSGGQLGVNIRINVADLIQILHPKVAPIIKDTSD